MTHGDLALDAGVDFLAVAEHRLIPARVRSEWSRLRGKGLSSIWAPASQDSSHVGHAGVGVVSLRGAPLALPTLITAQFKSFFDCGRALRCLFPLANGRFLHVCVLYGFQGADSDAEQFALTEQLFDAALGELYVAALGQPCLLVGDFNVEPTKIPCLAKGISAGLWVDFGEAWAIASGLQPAATCKRSWTADGGHRRDFILGCPLAAAAIFLVVFSRIGGLLLTWLFMLFLIMVGGMLGLLSPFVVLLFGLPLGCLLLIRLGVLGPLRFRGFGRFMMSGFSLCLGVMLFCLMSLLVWMMSLWPGLSGRELPSLHLLMRIGLVVVLFPLGVLSWVGVLPCFAGFSLVVLGFAVPGLMLLMLWMRLMFSFFVITRLLLCLI